MQDLSTQKQRRRSCRRSDRDLNKVCLFLSSLPMFPTLNNMLPHGKSELSHSWHFDGCCLQHMYGVMAKPPGRGRDVYLWVAVSEASTLSFCCCDSFHSFCPSCSKNSFLTCYSVKCAPSYIVCQEMLLHRRQLSCHLSSVLIPHPAMTGILYPLVGPQINF